MYLTLRRHCWDLRRHCCLGRAHVNARSWNLSFISFTANLLLIMRFLGVVRTQSAWHSKCSVKDDSCYCCCCCFHPCFVEEEVEEEVVEEEETQRREETPHWGSWKSWAGSWVPGF